MDGTAILYGFRCYQQAPAPLRDHIRSGAHPIRLEAGTQFYRQGSPCAPFVLVGAGDIRVFKLGDTGREITLYHIQPGQTCLVNMLCAYLDMESPASAVAETVVEALTVPAAMFRAWVNESDAMRRFVLETAAARVLDLMTLVEEIAFHKLDQRLAQHLLQRFDRQRDEANAIAVTHEEIAAELGSAREVVSRLLKEFERLGAIATGRGRIELREGAVLRQIGL